LYLRHRNGEFWLDGLENSTLFKNDATFRPVLIPNR
jgi:hypothetical protein